jgi:hypothetical protein
MISIVCREVHQYLSFCEPLPDSPVLTSRQDDDPSASMGWAVGTNGATSMSITVHLLEYPALFRYLTPLVQLHDYHSQQKAS